MKMGYVSFLELNHPGGAQSRVTAYPHQKKPINMVWLSAHEAFQMPSRGGVCDITHWKEASGRSWDFLERLHLLVDFGTSQHRPGRYGGGGCGERGLGCTAQTVLPSS